MGDGTWAGLWRGMRAIGQVYLWGKIVEFEQGYRAQFCYPKTILAPAALQTQRLCEIYGCEDERSCTWESLFESTELSLSETRYMHFSPTPPTHGTMYGISRVSLPLPLIPKPGDLVYLTADQSKSQSANPPKLAANRSHPKLLRSQIAQREQQAKSDFWKHL